MNTKIITCECECPSHNIIIKGWEDNDPDWIGIYLQSNNQQPFLKRLLYGIKYIFTGEPIIIAEVILGKVKLMNFINELTGLAHSKPITMEIIKHVGDHTLCIAQLDDDMLSSTFIPRHHIDYMYEGDVFTWNSNSSKATCTDRESFAITNKLKYLNKQE